MRNRCFSYLCGMTFGLSMLILSSSAGAQAPPAAPAAPAAPGAPAAPAVPAVPAKIQPTKKQDVKKAVEGKEVPDVKLLYAFENKMGSLKEIMNSGKARAAKVKLVTFVNTACASCMDEIRLLQDLRDKHKDMIFIVAVVTDRNADRVTDALGEDVKAAFTFLIDPYFSSPPVFGFKSTPATVFVKGDNISKLEQGYLPTDEGRQEMTDLVESHLK